MSDFDMIRRIDAMQACQVGPPDEWARATKSGYNQAATDCAMNILRLEPVATSSAAQIAADTRVQALVEALEKIRHEASRARGEQSHRDACKLASRVSSAALAAFKEPVRDE